MKGKEGRGEERKGKEQVEAVVIDVRWQNL